MPEELAVQQNTEGGPSTSLPQGGAAQVNAVLPETTVPGGEMIDVPLPVTGEEGTLGEETADLELAGPDDYEPAYTPEDEDDAFITGPSDRPDESILEGVQAMPNANQTTESLRRSLPSLVAASNAPGAPENMRVIVRFLTREANK